MKTYLFLVVTLLGLLVAACGGDDPTAVPTTASTVPAAVSTDVPSPTDTPIQTSPAVTTAPTNTPVPSPTAMMEPTAEAMSGAAVDALIQDFTHVDLTIDAGTTVTWDNRDPAPHTVTSGRPTDSDTGSVWDSGTMAAGRTFSRTFQEMGTFLYFCRIHPSMQATVTVVAAPPPPSPTAMEPTDEAMAGATLEALIQNFAHIDLTIEKGTTATWDNRDPAPHTVTSGRPTDSDTGSIWDSSTVAAGMTFDRTFQEVGTFLYFCRIHESMQATVTVVDAMEEQPTPTTVPTSTSVPPTSTPTSEPAPTDTPVPTPTATIEPTTEPITGPTVDALIQNFAHLDLIVEKGSTVKWDHRDPAPHTSTFGNPSDSDTGAVWDSGTFNSGGSFGHTFNEVGVFPYFCRIHPSMQATVTVVESLDEPPAAESTTEPTPTTMPTEEPPPAPVSETHNVDATGTNRFSQANITINVGDTVVWTVTGSLHTTTSGSPGDEGDLWDSDFLRVGDSFSHTFLETGQFPYFCRVHGSSMSGTVTVAGSTANPSAASASPYG